MLIAHQPRQGLGKRGARGIAQHVRNGRCHDLQRVLAGIAFGDEVSQAGDENLSVLTGRKLLNLTREPADGFDAFVIGQAAQLTELIVNGLRFRGQGWSGLSVHERHRGGQSGCRKNVLPVHTLLR